MDRFFEYVDAAIYAFNAAIFIWGAVLLILGPILVPFLFRLNR